MRQKYLPSSSFQHKNFQQSIYNSSRKQSKFQSQSIISKKSFIKQNVENMLDQMQQLYCVDKQKQSLRNIMKVLNQNNYHPEQIPCRDNQKFQIQTFIVNAVTVGHSSEVLYIGGVSGIGKTLCVKSVIDKIKNNQKYQEVYKPKYLYQNAMKIRQPKDIFKSILYHLADIKIDSNKAMCILNNYFENGESKQIKVPVNIPKILIIDQMDYLTTKQNQVIYTIVEWIRHKKSHLSIVAISNTFDLPESFSTKIQSRFGSKRIIFKQYTIEQIGLILQSRLKDCQGVFSKQAVQYICHKIGGQHTDIRKCLAILRESVNKELTGRKYKKPSKETSVSNIPLYIVKEVIEQMFSDSFVDTWSQFPQAYRNVLLYMAHYFRDQKQSLAYSQLQHMLGNSIMRVNQLRSILYDLKDLGLIKIRYMVLRHDNRIDKSFKLTKSVQQQFITLLVEVQKIFIARDNQQRQNTQLKSTDKIGWGQPKRQKK